MKVAHILIITILVFVSIFIYSKTDRGSEVIAALGSSMTIPGSGVSGRATGWSEDDPYIITSSANITIDINNGPFQKLTQGTSTVFAWDFGGTSSGGNISLDLIDGDSFTQTWNVGNWVGGSNGTIDGPWEQIIFHGTNTTALTGAELDADL